MRVAVYHNNSDIRIEERPVPKIGPGEILVRIRASGICGSDVMEWYRVPKAPIVLGHEVAGDIVEVGEGVTQLSVGQRVVVSHHVPCNTCRLCLSGYHTACPTLHTTNFDPGGFAEYVRVPALQTERGVLVLPDDVTYEEGSFVEPLGCVVRAQTRAGVRPGSTVLVIGSGISGLLHIRLAVALGAGRVFATDVNEYRLDWARRAGATAAFDAVAAGDRLPGAPARGQRRSSRRPRACSARARPRRSLRDSRAWRTARRSCSSRRLRPTSRSRCRWRISGAER